MIKKKLQSMNIFKWHIRKSAKRRKIAGMMLLVYLAVMLAPLTTYAISSGFITHAITGECSGDCTIDGCSLESRANHTCCCALKKHSDFDAKKSKGEHVALDAASDSVVSICEHCAVPDVDEAENSISECCIKGSEADSGKSLNKGANTKSETVYKCDKRCGSGKLFTVSAGTSEFLLDYFDQKFSCPVEGVLSCQELQRLISRFVNPPDPPPKLNFTV
jgi:hypothetical protein